VRIARVLDPDEPTIDRARLAFVQGDEATLFPDDSPVDGLEMLLASGPAAIADAQRAANGSARHRLADLSLLAPFSRPSKILCVGQNYVEHNEETKFERPAEPPFFSKFPSSIVGPGASIDLPSIAPKRVDYEAELAVVIGRPGSDIQESEAMSFVAGYTVGNDVSARDWQVKKPGGQWLLGKTFDTFLPLGPMFVSSDEIADPHALRLTCTVSGELLQDDTTGSMIFSISELIAYVSRVCSLAPGDIILTGTPGGVGMSRTPPRWLRDGDVVISAVEGVGILENPVRSLGIAG
jgi:2-keto-4-pentenoate hydratase/2-oxohepta-3-ene-1,7-dioic acid hydratase in catechol pathway